MQIDPNRVKRFIEVEYDCEVDDLHLAPIIGHDAVIVEGRAWRKGEELLVGGSANPRNFSGVKVWSLPDDPFSDLGKIKARLR